MQAFARAAPQPATSICPIFLFSSPRAGSTLVQRVIAAHDGIATASEPWLLLPHVSALGASGKAGYPRALAASAVSEFCDTLPGGMADYKRELREFVLRLYELAAGPQARYFLDKTPPYYFIAEEIIDLFPEGRFVFLWRNPLSIMASIIDSWQGGRWHPTSYADALFVGLPRLVAAYQAHIETSFAVRYEDLVRGESVRWRELMDYIGVTFEHRALESYLQVPLGGRMGDTTGPARYRSVSAEPTSKWQRVLANPLRRAWARRYLRWLGAERLAVMGYELDRLLEELAAPPLTLHNLGRDGMTLAEALALEPARSLAHRAGLKGPSALLTLLRA